MIADTATADKDGYRVVTVVLNFDTWMNGSPSQNGVRRRG